MGDLGIVHVVNSHHHEARLDTGRHRSHSVEMSERLHDGLEAHVGRLLRNHVRDRALTEQLNRTRRRIERNDLDRSTQTLIRDHVARALSREHVRAIDAVDVVRQQRSFRLSGSLRRIILVVVDTNQRHAVVGINRFTTPLFTLIRSRDTRRHVLDVDVARTADRFDQRHTRNPSTFSIRRTDVRQRRSYRTVHVVAVTNECVNCEIRKAGVLQRRNHGFLVDRSQEQEVQVPRRNHRLENRCLLRHIPRRRDLNLEVHTQRLGSTLSATLHRDI